MCRKTKESACYKRILRNRCTRNTRKLIQSNLGIRLDNNTICEDDKKVNGNVKKSLFNNKVKECIFTSKFLILYVLTRCIELIIEQNFYYV